MDGRQGLIGEVGCESESGAGWATSHYRASPATPSHWEPTGPDQQPPASGRLTPFGSGRVSDEHSVDARESAGVVCARGWRLSLPRLST